MNHKRPKHNNELMKQMKQQRSELEHLEWLMNENFKRKLFIATESDFPRQFEFPRQLKSELF